MKVSILLSTYNGEEFLEEQLNSLVAQTYRDFNVYIRDDGSSDTTLDIINEFCRKDSRFELVEHGLNIGCASSFIRLLEMVDSDVYMFCDQDDVWMTQKIAKAVSFFETKNDDIPIVYHTDLFVVDRQLNILSDSFLSQQAMSAKYSMTSNSLFIQNFVVGCTMAFNRSTVKSVFASNVNLEYVAMHDWWLSLIAKTMGFIYFDNESTILYRQHGNNVLGAQSNNISRFVSSFFSGDGVKRVSSFIEKISFQARAFLNCYYDSISLEHKKSLKLVSQLNNKNRFVNLMACYANGVRMQGFKRNIALVYTSLFYKK